MDHEKLYQKREMLNYIRDLLHKRDGTKCTYCGHEMSFAATKNRDKPQNYATIEHIIPRSEEIDNSLANLVLACYFCNQLRTNFPKASIFKKLIEEILENEAMRAKWHNFTDIEKRKVQRIVWGCMRQIDPLWAEERDARNKT